MKRTYHPDILSNMSLVMSVKYIHDVNDDTILQVSCQEPSMSSKYPHQGQGVLDTLLIMLEC